MARTIMCHIDRTISDVRAVIDLAQTGIWLEYDLFGLENSYYPYNPSFDMPNDGGRMAHILALIAAGHGDRLLLSHDIAYKTSLVKTAATATTIARQRGAPPARQGRGRRRAAPAPRRQSAARLRVRLKGSSSGGRDARAGVERGQRRNWSLTNCTCA